MNSATDVAHRFHPPIGGERVQVTMHPHPVSSIADGLLTTTGSLTWPIIKEHVEDVFVVTEDEIARAMKLIFERMKVVVEPSAAVGLAVVLFNEEFKKLKDANTVGIVLCGGNLDLDLPLPWTK